MSEAEIKAILDATGVPDLEPGVWSTRDRLEWAVKEYQSYRRLWRDLVREEIRAGRFVSREELEAMFRRAELSDA